MDIRAEVASAQARSRNTFDSVNRLLDLQTASGVGVSHDRTTEESDGLNSKLFKQDESNGLSREPAVERAAARLLLKTHIEIDETGG